MANNRRPQMPKRRNFVKKHMDQLHKPQTHRDHTKYDRYEDYLKDQLDDLVNDGSLWDDDEDTKKRAEFKAKLAGEEYDPDNRKNYEDWLQRAEIAEEWYPYDPYDIDDDYDY